MTGRASPPQPGTAPAAVPPAWAATLAGAWDDVAEANLFLVAGGVAYAVLGALFPGLAALVCLYGLVLDPAQVERQVAIIAAVLPPEAVDLIAKELHALVQAPPDTLGIGGAIGVLVALWLASRGMSGMIAALGIAFGLRETRGFLRLNALAIGLTLATLAGGTLAIALVGVLPLAVERIGLGAAAKWALLVLEWPLLIALAMGGLGVLYRYGPDRRTPARRWLTPGAWLATALWVAGSLGFSVYVTHFDGYGRTYGALGGVVVTMTWLWLSAVVALFGAVVNARRPGADTPARPPRWT